MAREKILHEEANKLEPLKVSCGDTSCPNGLHCYRRNGRLARRDQRPDGTCWSCGDDSVDWTRIHQCELADLPFLIRMLRTETIRYAYWETDITEDEKAYDHARRKGKNGVRKDVRHRIVHYLRQKGNFDGRQTPKTGNAIFYAQHATATCCRRCMSYWYGIPMTAILSDAQVDFFATLCMNYIEEKLPNLTADGERIPRRRNTDSGAQ